MADPSGYSYNTHQKKTFHAADYGIFSATLIASAGIGMYYAIKDRNKNTTEEFLMGGRKRHVIPVALSLLSSFISAITLLGTPAEVYTYNTLYWYICVGFVITAAGAAHIFIPIFYRLRITSTFEYIELRFGGHVRLLSSVIYLVWMLVYMAVVLYGPSLALNAVTGLSLWGSVIAVGLVCTLYTALGGMKAVLWADTLQMFIIIAGLLCIVIEGFRITGGISEAWNIAENGGRISFFEFNPDPSLRYSTWNVVLGGAFFWCAIYGVNQAQVQRAISVSTLREAQLVIWLNFPGMILIMTLVMLAGVAIYAFYHSCDPLQFGLIEKGDQLLPLFAMDILGHMHGLPGLILSCVFSGSLSTISSGLNAIAAVLLQDFVKPFCFPSIKHRAATILSKVIVIASGLVALAVAFVVSNLQSILQAALVLFGTLGGPILGIFTLGILFPWANRWGALAGEFTSVVFLLWIGLGRMVNNVSVTPKSPISTVGCNWTVIDNTGLLPNVTGNITTTVTTEIIKQSSSPEYALYGMSTMWYTGTAVLTTVVVGLIVSFITGYTIPSTLDPALVCPFFDTFFPFLPEKILKPLRFGVRQLEDSELLSALAEYMEPTTIEASKENGIDNIAMDNTDTK